MSSDELTLVASIIALVDVTIPSTSRNRGNAERERRNGQETTGTCFIPFGIKEGQDRYLEIAVAEVGSGWRVYPRPLLSDLCHTSYAFHARREQREHDLKHAMGPHYSYRPQVPTLKRSWLFGLPCQVHERSSFHRTSPKYSDLTQSGLCSHVLRQIAR